MKSLTILCIMVSSIAWSQQENKKILKNNVFLELLGNGGYASVNYERILLSHNSISICPSLGLSTFRIKDFTRTINPDIIIPIGLRIYYGSKHVLILGVGQTISSIVRLNDETFKATRNHNLSANLMTGYRINFKRINLQLAYTPILQNYTDYINWLGFSVGYKF